MGHERSALQRRAGNAQDTDSENAAEKVARDVDGPAENEGTARLVGCGNHAVSRLEAE